MAITINKDPNTGLEVNGLYYRIDKINFNDHDFQVILTGYASEEAYRNRAFPLIQPKAYTIDGYDKEELANSNVFEFAYKYVKTIEGFEDAEDVFEEGQIEAQEIRNEIENQITESTEANES